MEQQLAVIPPQQIIDACQYNDGCGETPCVCGENAPEADPNDIDEPDNEPASESDTYHAERSYEASRLREPRGI